METSSRSAPAPRKPRIIVVTRKLERGGTEMHLCRILPEVRAANIDISLFLLERGGVLEPELKGRGVPIAGPDRRGGRLVHALRSAAQLARHIRQERPDAVHYFLPEPYVIGSLVSPFAGSPLRLMSRRSLSNYQAKYPWLGALERVLHRGTAALLGNSGPVIEQLIDEGADPDRVGLIVNGVPPLKRLTVAQCAALRQELRLQVSRFVMIVVANLIPYKGHGDLLQALALANPMLPVDWRLLVVGRDEGIMARLQTEAISFGIAEHVHWLGERRDVASLLQIVDLAILPSHQEGSPNSLIEAMMAGLPVIATAVGGNRELVNSGAEGNGLLVPVQDPAALARAIEQMARSGELRQSAGRRGYEFASGEFAMDACVRRYVALYTNLSLLGDRPLKELLR